MSERKLMTAEEGADRVWARWLAKRDAKSGSDTEKSDEASEPQYKCECCGSDEFELIHQFDEVHRFETSLPCSCGEHEVAAVRQYVEVKQISEFGVLLSDHHCEFDNREEERPEREPGDSEVTCQECVDQAELSDWDTEEVSEPEVDPTTERYELRCATCNHEIEFGWSHPNQSGRFWPCESSDFNPKKCCPESRFEESWKRRDWLRPPPNYGAVETANK